MTNQIDEKNSIIYFGKYKGKTVEQIKIIDPEYLIWLGGQNWFVRKFTELHAAITGLVTHDDTPEHNAIQARFLDPVFCLAFMLVLYKIKEGEKIKFEVKFERRNIDVMLEMKFSASNIITEYIEIKPSVGDNYPAILRQLNRLTDEYRKPILLYDQFTSTNLAEKQVCEMIEKSGYKIVTLAEVEYKIIKAQELIDRYREPPPVTIPQVILVNTPKTPLPRPLPPIKIK